MPITPQEIEAAKEKFGVLLAEQGARIDRMKNQEFIDFKKLDKIIIGVVGGDGIGPAITKQAARLLKSLLKDEISAGKAELRDIGGLTIENRAAVMKAIPDDVLAELKKCHVILKGPTTTPEAGSPWPNIESANVAMRKELDLFANVRPVRVPEEGIDWTFFRENTEGAYAVGSKGVQVGGELAVDFTVTTSPGTERIARAAFEYARNNGKSLVTAVTKANVIKTTDGRFLNVCREVAKEYQSFGIAMDEWYIDIMTAKLIDKKRRTRFQVFVLPNLYGDILTDEAAEFQGGVGTAGSANIGARYAMFEAIHGSAPRMVAEGRAAYADPASVMRAAAMLLSHIGFGEKAAALDRALDFCLNAERRAAVTGRPDGATSEEFADYVMETVSKDSIVGKIIQISKYIK
ncbi:MAG: isocitrate/isopropylmalate family dehydrogenase [Firmicutes bacterium]|nr:isocitrate/isopropylmalate family dehydrogenase [Bacillota bacterium]